MNKRYFLIVCLMFASKLYGQVLTSEDSLSAGLVASDNRTMISGYGEAAVNFDVKDKQAEATLKRAVLFVGHKFNNRISLFTELELEDARVEGGESGGEIAMEQAFIKFDLNPSHYFVAGLFVSRIGIINENHLPTTYNGVERPFVEQFVIPSTWREIGIGYYGSSSYVNGLNYSLSLTNGLNSEGFENGTGIRGGRQEGARAKLAGLAASGALLYYYKNLRFQVSTYVGGSTTTLQRVADSIGLHNGMFANPVFLNEVNAQYRKNGLEIKALACQVNIPNADNINNAFANNTPEKIFGAYGEVGYNLLSLFRNTKGRSLTIFGRYEYMDLNQKITVHGNENDANKKSYLIGGITYKPLRGVCIKADYTNQTTGNPNSTLFPQQLPYFRSRGFVNIGIGYSF